MNQLQLDVLFIQETFKEPPNGFTQEAFNFDQGQDMLLSSIQTSTKVEGVQFRIASRLESFVLEAFCLKSHIMEILTIKIHQTILVPDGRSTNEIQQ